MSFIQRASRELFQIKKANLFDTLDSIIIDFKSNNPRTKAIELAWGFVHHEAKKNELDIPDITSSDLRTDLVKEYGTLRNLKIQKESGSCFRVDLSSIDLDDE